MLYEKTNYTADISYLTNVFITEYDISKCNINVLYKYKAIDEQTYQYLYQAERMVRQVYVGKLQRESKEIVKILKSGIEESKKMLFEANNLQDRDVLSIKTDAVFVIKRKLQNRKFGLIEFMPIGLYTSFFRLRNLELYYYYNNVNKNEYLEVKGISDDKLALHEQYFVQLLKDIFYSIQINGPEITLRMLKDAYIEYINLQMPVGYYRKFDADSTFHLKHRSFINTGFAYENIAPEMLPNVDITYNASLLLELQKIIISIYFNKHK